MDPKKTNRFRTKYDKKGKVIKSWRVCISKNGKEYLKLLRKGQVKELTSS